jgi:hypothetical protein
MAEWSGSSSGRSSQAPCPAYDQGAVFLTDAVEKFVTLKIAKSAGVAEI